MLIAAKNNWTILIIFLFGNKKIESFTMRISFMKYSIACKGYNEKLCHLIYKYQKCNSKALNITDYQKTIGEKFNVRSIKWDIK